MGNEMTMEQVLQELLEKHEERGYALLDLTKRERQLIIHADVKMLEKATYEKIQLKDDISKIEDVRIKLMGHFARKYDIRKTVIHLSDIIEKVSDPFKGRYKELQSSLKKTFQAVQRLHDGNRILISRSIALQEKTFMLVYGLTKGKVRYEKSGEITLDSKQLVDSVM
jgi:hypothetical protein